MTEVDPERSNGPAVGLINLMPYASQEKTQQQWAKLLGADLPLKFDDDPREGADCRSAEHVSVCVPFSEAADRLGALVVTGANLELADPGRPQQSDLLPLERIRYLDRLHDVIDWSVESEKLTVYSCLASHIALSYLFGLDRDRGVGKTFGVYEHEVQSPGSVLVEGVGENLLAPHSRWGDVPTKLLEDCGIEVIAVNEGIGWLIARYENSIFLQGHPEYGAQDLVYEYSRDKANNQALPENYFPDDNPSHEPLYSWKDDSKALFANIRRLVDPKTIPDL